MEGSQKPDPRKAGDVGSKGPKPQRKNESDKEESRCKPEEMDTKEYGKMLTIIFTLEEGRVPDRKEKRWKVEGEKRRGHQERERQRDPWRADDPPLQSTT